MTERKVYKNKYGLTGWYDQEAYYRGDDTWMNQGFKWRDMAAVRFREASLMECGDEWDGWFGTDKTALLKPFYRIANVVGANAFCTERLIKPKINRLIDGNQRTPLWMRLVMVGEAIVALRRLRLIWLVKIAYDDRQNAYWRYGEYGKEMRRNEIVAEVAVLVGKIVKFAVRGVIWDMRVVFGKQMVGIPPRMPNPLYAL